MGWAAAMLCAASEATSDSNVLLQSGMTDHGPAPHFSLTAGISHVTATNDSDFDPGVLNGSNNSSEQIRYYRFNFKETHGATYHCLSELELYDDMLHPIVPTFKNQSSCYGCATQCEGCTENYGNPLNQFVVRPDNVSILQEHINNPDRWSCSSQGSFYAGQYKAGQVITFSAPIRPARYILRRFASGTFVAKSWNLEELQPDGVWAVINVVQDATIAAVQSVDVQVTGNMIPPPVFLNIYQKCGGGAPTEVQELSTNTGNNSTNFLTYAYTPAANCMLMNNGHGVQIDNTFGTLTLDERTYNAIQFHFQFPSEYRMNNGELAVGELHILHQKEWIIGEAPQLAVVTVLLNLPLEGSEPETTEMFFRSLGLENLPSEEEPRPIGPVDLTVLSNALNSPYVKMPCADATVHWFVMSQSAFVSGRMVQAFRDKFMNPVGFEANVDADGNPIGTESLTFAANNSTEEASEAPNPWRNRALPVVQQYYASIGHGEFESLTGSDAVGNTPAPTPNVTENASAPAPAAPSAADVTAVVGQQ
jgi:carbonic anhydrase